MNSSTDPANCDDGGQDSQNRPGCFGGGVHTFEPCGLFFPGERLPELNRHARLEEAKKHRALILEAGEENSPLQVSRAQPHATWGPASADWMSLQWPLSVRASGGFITATQFPSRSERLTEGVL